jgi:chromosome segregation ATPase
MIEETINKIAGKISDAENVPAAQKQELLNLLDQLKAHVNTLAQTNGEQAQSIADSVHASAQAATGDNQNPEALENSVAGLRSSVEGFEQSHPKLVQVVNSISNVLSNSGI